MAQRIVFNNDAAKHIQAYIEYNNMVGDNGGKLMSEKEYEDFKKNYAKNTKNRIYASWRNQRGLDCKMIGPASMCFCGHRFKEHEFLQPVNKKVFCKRPKCTCPTFGHVPQFGANDFKCLCKHSYTEHDPISKKCSKGQCGCNKFSSTWSCSCGSKFGDHQTIFETREERILMGKPVDDMNRLEGDLNVPYMPGGLASFSALADGADRYETYIDQLGQQQQQRAIRPGSQQRAIKGAPEVNINHPSMQPTGPRSGSQIPNTQQRQSQQQQMDLPPRQRKLNQLNQKISESSQQQQQQNEYALEKQDRTLLNLFQTPHIYANVTLNARHQRRIM